MSDIVAQKLISLFNFDGKTLYTSELTSLSRMIGGLEFAVTQGVNAGLTKEDLISKMPEVVEILWNENYESDSGSED